MFKVEISGFESLIIARQFVNWFNKNKKQIISFNTLCEIYDDKNKKRKLKPCNSKKLPLLMKKYNEKCDECGIKVKMMREIKNQKEYIFLSSKQQIMHETGTIYGIATVEHIKRVSDNGTNHISNIKLLCASCNNKKDKESRKLWQNLIYTPSLQQKNMEENQTIIC